MPRMAGTRDKRIIAGRDPAIGDGDAAAAEKMDAVVVDHARIAEDFHAVNGNPAALDEPHRPARRIMETHIFNTYPAAVRKMKHPGTLQSFLFIKPARAKRLLVKLRTASFDGSEAGDRNILRILCGQKRPVVRIGMTLAKKFIRKNVITGIAAFAGKNGTAPEIQLDIAFQIKGSAAVNAGEQTDSSAALSRRAVDSVLNGFSRMNQKLALHDVSPEVSQYGI